MQISDFVNKRKAGYGLDECNSAVEVRNAKVPILMIHGSADSFVPCSMCDTIYENCSAPKKKLIIEGAAHVESYYKDPEAQAGPVGYHYVYIRDNGKKQGRYADPPQSGRECHLP